LRQEVVHRVARRFDSPVNRGQLCVKGRFGYDFIHAADRLTQPLLRRSRGLPLVPVAWDTAL